MVAMLHPVAASTYTQADYDAFVLSLSKASPGECFKKDDGIQFYAIHTCFDKVRDYEAAKHIKYAWVVRARPDTRFLPNLPSAIQKHVLPAYGPKLKRAWLRKGRINDAFAILSRSAADAYGHSFSRIISCSAKTSRELPSGTICEALDLGSPRWYVGAECFLYRNMVAGGINVTFDSAFGAQIIRNKKHRHLTAHKQ
jgi:hypothetical protein